MYIWEFLELIESGVLYPEEGILRVERYHEKALYDIGALTEETMKRIRNGDVPVPEKGALFWGPYEYRRILPPDIFSIDPRYIRGSQGVVSILPGPGRVFPVREAVWVAEKISPLFEGVRAAQATVDGGLLLETPQGTVEISKTEDFWGVLFWDPHRKQYVRVEADVLEKLPEVMRMILRERRYDYFPGVNLYFL